jgi:hypothetical protein
MFRTLMGLVGIVGLVVATSLLLGGGSLLLFEATLADEDGFINSVPFEIEVDGYAVVAGPAEIDLTPKMPFDLGEIVTLRIRAVRKDTAQGIFVGVADPADVDTYLGGVPYAIVEDLDNESFSLTYRVDVSGEAPGSPGGQAFWIDSTHGEGSQTIEWEIESGDVSFVVMNEDAVDGISFEADIGARVPLIRPVGTALLIGGGAALAVGTILLALAL